MFSIVLCSPFFSVTKRLNLSILFLQIIGVDYVFFIQKNLLDRRRRTLIIEAYNESFASRVEVMETCRYFVSTEIFFCFRM